MFLSFLAFFCFGRPMLHAHLIHDIHVYFKSLLPTDSPLKCFDLQLLRMERVFKGLFQWAI